MPDHDELTRAIERLQPNGDEARRILHQLVMLKDGPRDEAYYREKPKAWDRARQLLKLPGSGSDVGMYPPAEAGLITPQPDAGQGPDSPASSSDQPSKARGERLARGHETRAEIDARTIRDLCDTLEFVTFAHHRTLKPSKLHQHNDDFRKCVCNTCKRARRALERAEVFSPEPPPPSQPSKGTRPMAEVKSELESIRDSLIQGPAPTPDDAPTPAESSGPTNPDVDQPTGEQ